MKFEKSVPDNKVQILMVTQAFKGKRQPDVEAMCSLDGEIMAIIKEINPDYAKIQCPYCQDFNEKKMIVAGGNKTFMLAQCDRCQSIMVWNLNDKEVRLIEKHFRVNIRKLQKIEWGLIPGTKH